MQFGQRAHQYAEHAHVQRQMADWLAEWLPGLGAPDCRVVEFGAGEGLFTRRALAYYYNLLAIDLASQMVVVGRGRAAGAEWREGDAWEAVGLSTDVSLVLSASLMQWCPDPATILRRWRSVLPTGARMLHGFYVDPTLAGLRALQGADTLPLQWRRPEEWRMAFEKAGWRIEQIDTVEHCVRYRSALELLRSLHGVGAVRRGQAYGLRLRRILREYDRQHALPEGGVSANWTFCRVQCLAR